MSGFAYCKDSKTGVLYIHGINELFTNMDIDCDGDVSDPGDGRCHNSHDRQSQTAFKDQVQDYSKIAGERVSDLNANFIPYVVFGNEGKKPGYKNFKPQDYGLQPLSVMAVVCPQADGTNKLVSILDVALLQAETLILCKVYGVWGDTNGDDDKDAMVGEASISLATACYGKNGIDGDHGHDKNDVLYIGFPGTVGDTVYKHATWAAKNFDDFESSIKAMGDDLVSKLS